VVLIKEDRGFQGLLEALNRVSKSYERTSKILTLGLESRFRGEAISRIELGRILDVGSGTGVMARQILKSYGRAYVVALEPLPGFLAILKGVLESPQADVVQGYIEYMPFRDKAFDTVIAGFMLRDVMDLGRSVSMMARASRKAFVILDFWRPNSVLTLLIEVIYMFFIMGLVAAISPRDIRGYMEMIRTVFRVPRIGGLMKLLKRLGRFRVRCWALCILFVARIDICSGI
jgi:demethylmenaquinone methyltransferase/2-methoxy-6-polyprenyl-1,4-benzoquinol methylase